MKSFGERLDWAIRTAGKNKTALALQMKVPQSSVSRWLTGSTPRAETLSAIAKFLGVPNDWLATGEIDATEWEALISERMEKMGPAFKGAVAQAVEDARSATEQRFRDKAQDASVLREDPVPYRVKSMPPDENPEPTLEDAMVLLRQAMRIMEAIQRNPKP